MMRNTLVVAGLAMMLESHVANALVLDLDSPASIKSVAATIAYDMMSIYKGNQSGQIPGLLPVPENNGYYWWEAGAMFGSMINYWFFTGDTSYNSVVAQGMLFQVGQNEDYQPPNQTKSLGNDDQGFWGMAAMTATELNFPNPPADQPQWLALAQAVYVTQADPSRHDNTCNGGLRWQIPLSNTGYNYKNAISNGIFMNLGARLARYTGNSTYTDWVDKTWHWLTSVGYLSDDWKVFDGGHVELNCTDVNLVQFSYNQAIMLYTAAVMYNYTNGSSVWRDRTTGLLNQTFETFFPNDIAYEVSCEESLKCNTDIFSQKAYLTRWMAQVAKLVPWTRADIMRRMRTSAAAAALQCSGGANGRMCGLSWSKGAVWDGTQGVGQQMAAMEVVQSNLLDSVQSPFTNSTGGTSVGDPNAGTSATDGQIPGTPVTTAGRVGAGFLTTFMLVGAVGGMAWISI